MLNAIFEIIFGCSHRRTSFPLTPPRRMAGRDSQATYVVCLDCGKEFGYDWIAMRIGNPVGQARTSEI